RGSRPAVVEIEPPGLIYDTPLFCARNAQMFASEPSAPIGINGSVAIGPDDRPQRRTVVRWRDSAAGNRLSAALAAAVKARHPEFFDIRTPGSAMRPRGPVSSWFPKRFVCIQK